MRSHYCNELNAGLNGEDVRLCGWAHRRRDHGGVIFIDLRDTTGLAQVVVDPDVAEAFALAERVRNEFVLAVRGRVRPRPEGTVNPNLPSGEVEVFASEIEICNPADTPPFQLDDEGVHDDVRLKYRYVDLRRPYMQRQMRLRHQVCQRLRRFLDERRFLEIETPLLTKATPEGGAGLFGAQPRASRPVLRFAAIPPAVQAAADDVRDGSLLPDRPLLP